MAIVLMVAVVAGASPAQSAIGPMADQYQGPPNILTPMPLDGPTMLPATAEPVAPNRRDSALDHAYAAQATKHPEALAAGRHAGSAAPFLAFLGVGALLALLVTLLMAGRGPRRQRTS